LPSAIDGAQSLAPVPLGDAIGQRYPQIGDHEGWQARPTRFYDTSKSAQASPGRGTRGRQEPRRFGQI